MAKSSTKIRVDVKLIGQCDSMAVPDLMDFVVAINVECSPLDVAGLFARY